MTGHAAVSLRRLAYAAAGLAIGALPLRAQQAQPPKEPEFMLYTGTGFVLTSSGYIATNNHVVAGNTKLEVRIPGQSQRVPATVVARDAERDLATIKAEVPTPLGNTPISFADPTQVRLGQDTFVLGFPLPDNLGASVRLTTGTISSLAGLRDDPSRYQISNPIQPGNSGGPVFNSDGQLVGVVVEMLNPVMMLESKGIVPQNVNFAVKGSVLKTLAEKIPDCAEFVRRATKVQGTREQQIETLTKFVVQIFNFEATVTTADHEFKRPASATMRVDVLGGRMSLFVDPMKWREMIPGTAGAAQQFRFLKSDAPAGVFILRFPPQSSIDAMKVQFARALHGDFPNATISAQQRRTVNGLPILALGIAATTSNAPLSMLAQLYSGPEGGVAVVAYSDQRIVDKTFPALEELVSGMEKPATAPIRSAPFLSEWTRRTLRRMTGPVVIRVFAPEADFPKFQSILTAYQDASPDVFAEYVDPAKSAEYAKAVGVGRVPAIHVLYKGRFVGDIGASEIVVTTALARLADGPQKMYFSYVHGERDLASTDQDGYSELAQLLGANNFSAERLVPTAENTVPADAAAVIIAGPKRDFSANQTASLKKYLASGGRVLLIVDPPAKRNGAPLPNLIALAKEFGIEIGDSGVRDATGKGEKIGDGLGVAITARPTAAAAGADPNAVAETRLAVVGDADMAANASIKNESLSGVMAVLLYWISTPIPPADRSK